RGSTFRLISLLSRGCVVKSAGAVVADHQACADLGWRGVGKSYNKPIGRALERVAISILRVLLIHWRGVKRGRIGVVSLRLIEVEEQHCGRSLFVVSKVRGRLERPAQFG